MLFDATEFATLRSVVCVPMLSRYTHKDTVKSERPSSISGGRIMSSLSSVSLIEFLGFPFLSSPVFRLKVPLSRYPVAGLDGSFILSKFFYNG